MVKAILFTSYMLKTWDENINFQPRFLFCQQVPYGAFLMFHHIVLPPVVVKISQKTGNHVAGIGGQGKFFPMAVTGHGADQRGVFQNNGGVFTDSFPVRCDLQAAVAAQEQLASQFCFQTMNDTADVGLRGVEATGCLIEAAFFTDDGEVF